MNNRWIFLLLLVVAMPLIMAGCPKEQAPGDEVSLAIDASKLPPPRSDVDVNLDLSGAKLVINDDTLKNMEANGVPSDIVDKMRGMNGQEFTSVAEFVAAVNAAAGDGASPHMENILMSSMVMALAEDPQAPEGAVTLSDAEQKAQIAATGSASPSFSFEIVYFEFDRSEIQPQFEAAIATNAQYLLENTSTTVTIEGHADNRGTNEYNLALGERRAQAVRSALIAQGVSANQLETQSWGEERLVSQGDDEASHAKNRRSEMVIN